MREEIATRVKQTGWPVYLHGPAGHGKSCFAALVYASTAGSGPKGSMWYSCRALLGQLAMARVNPEKSIEELCPDGSFQQVDFWVAWNRLRTTGLVVIDDLGRTPLTEVQSSLLCEILDMRQSLMTIVTGNFGREELATKMQMDLRLISRLCSGTDFYWKAEDRRTKVETGVDYSGGGHG